MILAKVTSCVFARIDMFSQPSYHEVMVANLDHLLAEAMNLLKMAEK